MHARTVLAAAPRACRAAAARPALSRSLSSSVTPASPEGPLPSKPSRAGADAGYYAGEKRIAAVGFEKLKQSAFGPAAVRPRVAQRRGNGAAEAESADVACSSWRA
jgi:hypothetical protein